MSFFEDRLAESFDVNDELVEIDIRINKSLTKIIEKYFFKWKLHAHYFSFDEMRSSLGFDYYEGILFDNSPYFIETMNVEDYLVYSEMILSIINFLNSDDSVTFDKKISDEMDLISNRINYGLGLLNYHPQCISEGKVWVVQNDPAATALVDIVEKNLADVIIEYNHFSMKGNLNKKRSLLQEIAHGLDGKKDTFKSNNNNKLYENFEFLVNNFNIRHRNDDESGKNFNLLYSELNDDQIENLYDNIYRQALLLYLLLDQYQRNDMISKLKENKNLSTNKGV